MYINVRIKDNLQHIPRMLLANGHDVFISVPELNIIGN